MKGMGLLYSSVSADMMDHRSLSTGMLRQQKSPEGLLQ
jgi:hypothetical protein